MLIQDIKIGILVLLLKQSEFTFRKWWYLQFFQIPTQVYQNRWINKTRGRLSGNRIFSRQNAENEHCETLK